MSADLQSYAEFHRRSIEQPDAFWAEQAEAIEWHRKPDRICDNDKPPFARWFVGGQTNLCHNAVDSHARERGEERALVWVSNEVGQERIYTFAELQAEVECMAAILLAQGVGQGDRV